MKKFEKYILIALVVISCVAIFIMKNPFKQTNKDIKVGILYQNELVQEFSPYEDAVYHLTGSYGELDVEVKDGKYRITNEDCPNHICSNMGWVGPDEDLPIVCMPNEVIVTVVDYGN